MLRIGIDTGGTFTDFVVLDRGKLSVFKLPSSPRQPSKTFLEGLLRAVAKRDGFLVQHGSTVATNALLERRGAKTVLVTNQGFEDVLEIGRQNRPGLYHLGGSRPAPLIPRRRRVGVKERLLWNGKTLTRLEQKSLDWLKNKVQQLAPEAVAVVLLYSYVNPESEQRIAEALQDNGCFISLSHQVLPEFREYERTSATVINAYVAPLMTSYLQALIEDPIIQRGRLSIMQSSGGTMSADAACRQPVRTLLSGPAGGVVGAFQLAGSAGHKHIISFDMGGTSTDVCLCQGEVGTTHEASIDHYPVGLQMIDIHTVGAGGGSIAWIDSGGLLRVGPQSAGADPGPACYGSGEEATVTDANLFLGLLNPDWFLGGEYNLHPDRARAALTRLARQLTQSSGRPWQEREVAEGIRSIVATQLERALRVISLERGYDTRDFTLVSFGGAGGLHACSLAASLMIPRILIPRNPGLLSALGILSADIVKDDSRTVLLSTQQDDLEGRLNSIFKRLRRQVAKELEGEGIAPGQAEWQRSVDARYLGQSYELNVPFPDFSQHFHQRHQSLYGYSNPQQPVEVVTVRVRGRGRFPPLELSRFEPEEERPQPEAVLQEKQLQLKGKPQPVRFYLRSRLRAGNRLKGPAVVVEYSSTTFIPAGFEAQVDAWLNLVVEPTT